MKTIIYVLFVMFPFLVNEQCNSWNFGILKAEVSSDSPTTQIDISGLPQGIYFVKLVNDKMVQVGKVIKW